LLINAMAQTGWFPPGQTDEACNQQMFAAVAALRAFKPTDEIEGMLAAQTVAMHFGAMECFRRAMVHDQPPEVASKLRKDGANLARGMTDMLDALDRKRGKGPQVVRVERVVVHEGGQAIVGNVQPAKVGDPVRLAACSSCLSSSDKCGQRGQWIAIGCRTVRAMIAINASTEKAASHVPAASSPWHSRGIGSSSRR